MTLTDADYMARALFHAARGRGRTSPNPVVGAVVVSADGVVVGQGYHARAGGAHAEVHALELAGPRARGGTLFCTLEPCSHTGRTGPCVPRIADAGIARVVAAVEDPNPLVRGRGFAYLEAHGIRVDIGLGVAGACALNQPFFTAMREGRPFVTLKAAISADGCLAEAPGRRTALTSTAANRHAHRVRAEVDAIGVGVGTVLVDDPLLTPRGVYRERPLTRVVFDRSLRTPPEARVLSTPAVGPVIIVTTAESDAHKERRLDLVRRGAEVVVADGTIRGAVTALADRGITSLLLEGGARLHAAAWDERIVDFVQLYVTPHVLGHGGVRFLDGRRMPPASLAHHRVAPIGPDVLVEGYVHGPR
ncbi:MAG TPA: bifunctional diaminohydroxyphosphoribosylaminopyrimidine deaminase/5-amino-6-(5-phosphoribosylamino)uracil reductase RibD [Vicinamibacterales bacterium]|nr:bifunctional diaminohydroxyphosphoribosylaminopyrimidine deaminase/5-amino-6-(5-phosphoribosylamino)uracil reductase RibD [Vicinamibacterales bacterium]